MISYLQVENISKRFGEQLLFENISFGISKGDKVAMIARNGMGKSTLMKIIAGKDSSETGNIIFRNDISVGFLEQEPVLNPDNGIFEEIFNSESEILNTIRLYEESIENDDNDATMGLIEKMDALKAWDYEIKIKQILSKLKIDKHNQKISMLSGGQKKRVGLAKVLIEEPDFIILDEPTNHLDIEISEWLEEYLSQSNITLLMVTHDRYFLDKVCNRIIEMDDFGLYNYVGNYSFYLNKRQERIENRNIALDKAKNLFKTEQEWMRRMPQARSHKSQYRIENFYKLKEEVAKDFSEDSFDFDIKTQRLGKKVIEIENLSKAYGKLKLISNFSYKFTRGEKIGIVGKNGVGKSTFLDVITQNISPDAGDIIIGETIVFGYYKQGGIIFKEDEKAIDYIKNIAEYVEMGNGKKLSASQFLEYFLFSDKQQYSPISKLSGGEKRRLFLISILMKSPNFLILDEPTNDLDIATLRVLEDYLTAFKGCLIVVSHDRFFMDRVVDRIFAFEGNGKIKDFPGNYTIYKNYLNEKEEDLSQIKKKESISKEYNKDKKKKSFFNEKKELKALDDKINSLNIKKQEIEELLNSGNIATDELVSKSEEIGKIIEDLEKAEMRWLEIDELINA